MSKLCQCRISKLLDRLWDIPDPYEDLVEQQLEDIEKILESDCVCEKKEVCSCRYHNDVCVGAPQRNGVCGLCPPNCFGKQSQPSEKKDALHEYLSKENPKEEDKEVLLKAYGYPDVPKQSQSSEKKQTTADSPQLECEKPYGGYHCAVCERHGKENQKCTVCKQYCGHACLVRERGEQPSNIIEQEKQSQSPCEHPKDKVRLDMFRIIDTESDYRSLWLCTKCGLVTCKNPNDK